MLPALICALLWLTQDAPPQKIRVRTDSVTVTTDVKDNDIQQPDPAQRVLVRDELLDANPGRPGAPVSIPGVPVETASGGIKAPQYFAPGVSGDHGEPIAQFLQVGSFLVPNNLSANAHGNGYADPNIVIPAIIESVATDGGAFNVREGNHSVDLSVTYVLRSEVKPFATLTADEHDADLSGGAGWFALEAGYGNGFLDRPERRQQYKINALEGWQLGTHKLSLLFVGYYGQSRIPGLVPIDIPDLHDTIDGRQRDQTHTGLLALNDVWRWSQTSELQVSGFFRTYNLDLISNFGDGLIRQSEFRTAAGADFTYVRHWNRKLSILSGFDYSREAPRRDDLDRLNAGSFHPVTANDITLTSLGPFVAIGGNLLPWLRYNAGWRRDEIQFNNVDLLFPANSFNRWIGIDSPKATVSLLPPDSTWLPSVSLSFGQAFFTNDPRIGTGNQPGSLTSRAHSYQLVVSKIIRKTDIRMTAGHVTQEASLARIDPDTGLQQNEGAARNRYVTVAARRQFGFGFLEGSISKADARDLSNGLPSPEAPRLIVDALGTIDRLPFGLHARAEMERVGSKPLGDGFTSVPVTEFRGALVRSFHGDRIQTGVHFQLASGYTGQTIETVALPEQGDAAERIVGVYLPSYVALSLHYNFGRKTSRAVR